jgi:hypothetical protein
VTAIAMSLVIAVAMVACWLLGILHPAMIGFIGSFLFAASGVDFDTAFHGFGTEMPWFLYGALLLVGAAERSGLVQWLAARTPRAFLRTPLAPAVVLIVLAYALALVVPSSLARATMLIILALSWKRDVLGLVASYAAAIGVTDVPGGLFAIAGWNVAAASTVLLSAAWHSRPSVNTDEAAAQSVTVALNPRIMAPVIFAIVLWLTTPLHALSPALVGLACGLISWLPGLAESGKHGPKADHLAVIFAGTAITLPAVFIETKAVDVLTRAWLDINQSVGPDSLVGYWSTVVYRMFSPDGARPALPIVGHELGSTAMWSYAGSTLLSLHQSPALILAMAVGGCRPKHVLTTGVFVLILGSLVVMLF